eukprot:TRINITY_DN27340_c0_g1_i1.p1 TRINITY_DN27340_c0_g1~~TRINITY_DN27340_c0_g1_i1.p1  ORF type:complete len:384 (+),score=84.22 TRINITY_DN27340_c0_g1_i1:62-1153(+)
MGALRVALLCAALARLHVAHGDSRIFDAYEDAFPADVRCPATCGDAASTCERLFSPNGLVVAVGADCEADENGSVLNFNCTCNEGAEGPMYVSEGDGMCSYMQGRFPPSPPLNPGSMCTPQTGRCRAGGMDCNTARLVYCTAQGGQGRCENGVLTCDLCVGGTLTVRLDTDTDDCITWEADPACTNAKDHGACSKHGCCSGGECTCFSDDNRGYWAGATCGSCDPGYEGKMCTSSVWPSLTTIFGGEPSALPAVIPFLFVLLLYVCFSGLRFKWTHEQPLSSWLYLEPVRHTFDGVPKDHVLYTRVKDGREVESEVVMTTYGKCRECKENPLIIPKRPEGSRGIKFRQLQTQQRMRMRDRDSR